MIKRQILPILVIAVVIPLFFVSRLPAQSLLYEDDPCGFPQSFGPSDALVWGYGLDTLAADLRHWSSHPWVRLDTIGNSVQGRPLQQLILTNPASLLPKKRIWIHARTHPIEAESSWLTRAIVNELLSGSVLATVVLDHCIVNILPMLNPDGVYYGYPRENVNGIDIESNWGATEPQPEVQALRSHFSSLMQSSSPIDIALNLHSAYQCRRYFVYHDPAGTSDIYATQQQRFINMVRSRFPGGIEEYDYFVTWTQETPDRYPESWFWLNFRENVLALTYEDMNCSSAGQYDRTAFAILGGAAEYMGIIGPVGGITALPDDALAITSAWPQPCNAGSGDVLNIGIRIPGVATQAHIDMIDALGRTVMQLWSGAADGERTLAINTGTLPAGSYYIRLNAFGQLRMRPIYIVR